MTNRLTGQNRLPGPTAKRDMLGPFQPLLNVEHVIETSGEVHADSVDVGHTDHTDVLRAGLLLFQVLTGAQKGQWVPEGHADAPAYAAVEHAAVLLETVNMADVVAADTEQKTVRLLVHGVVDEDKLWYGTSNYLASFKSKCPNVIVLKNVT